MKSKVIKTTETYQVRQYGNVYALSFFDECISHPTFNRHKTTKQSRVTKNFEYIKKFL